MDRLRADADKEKLDVKSFIKKHYNFSPADVQNNYIHIKGAIGLTARFNRFMADYHVTFANNNSLLKSLKPDKDGFVYTPQVDKKSYNSGELSSKPYYFDRGSRGGRNNSIGIEDIKSINRTMLESIYRSLGK